MVSPAKSRLAGSSPCRSVGLQLEVHAAFLAELEYAGSVLLADGKRWRRAAPQPARWCFQGTAAVPLAAQHRAQRGWRKIPGRARKHARGIPARRWLARQPGRLNAASHRVSEAAYGAAPRWRARFIPAQPDDALMRRNPPARGMLTRLGLQALLRQLSPRKKPTVLLVTHVWTGAILADPHRRVFSPHVQRACCVNSTWRIPAQTHDLDLALKSADPVSVRRAVNDSPYALGPGHDPILLFAICGGVRALPTLYPLEFLS